MDRIVWVLRIVETSKKILNPITWEVYFPSTSERVLLLLISSLYFRFNWFVFFGSECARRDT